MERSLKHYYHIYAAVGGQWKEPVSEHLNALRSSGLEKELDFFGVGIVGNPVMREMVKHYLQRAGFDFKVVAVADMGWEQITLDSIVCWAGDNVLYAHTKGAANPSEHSDMWRASMTEGVVYRWRRAVDLLDGGVDAVGSHWLEIDGFGRHYSGNYWWARGEYLEGLPRPCAANTRWDAETWVGGNGSGGGVMYDLAAGPANGGNWLYENDPGQDGVPEGCVRFRVNNNIAGLTKGQIVVRVRDAGVEMCINEGHFQVLGKRVEKVYDYRV